MNSTAPSTTLATRLLLVVSLGAFAGTAAAQCNLVGEAILHMPDADGDVLASAVWDPDGVGPRPPVVVLGGSFRVLGDAASPGLVLYEPVSRQYSTLGTGIAAASGTASIVAITVLPNNDVCVAGAFTSIDGVPANRIARWDGTAWQAMAGGFAIAPLALTSLPNGHVVAAGPFWPSDVVQRWDGIAWLPMATGLTTGATPRVLATLANGDVAAGGHHLVGTTYLARWDGTTWSAWPANTDNDVFALQPLPNGDLVAAGFFTTAGGVAAPGIARWDGSAWSALGGGLTNPPLVRCLSRLPNGDLVAGGVFTQAGNVAANQVARWDGASWSAMGAGLGHPFPADEPVFTLQATASGDVLGGGRFRSSDRTTDQVARWNGSTWTSLRTGTGGSIFDVTGTANGALIAVGDFTNVEGVAAHRIAVHSAGTWQPLGGGIDDGAVRALLTLPNGDIVVGGTFTSAGGVAANRIARWDGAAWNALGSGLPDTVQDLAFHAATGQILAAGTFDQGFVMWNGTGWNGTGVDQPGGLLSTRNFVTTPDGSVLAFVANAVSRWNGIGWVPLTPAPFTFPPVPLGSGLLAAPPEGGFAVASGARVSRWNGTTWTSTTNAPFTVTSLLALPDGDLLVGSSFALTQPPGERLARWDGTAWSKLGGGPVDLVARLRRLDDGRIVAAGSFTSLFGVATNGLAEIRSTCPATVVESGSGCTGSGGGNHLTATSLPWIGAPFTSVATGMPNGVAVEVLGFGALSLPIDMILPEGVPGCVLTTTPDDLRQHATGAGVVDLALAIPNVPSFVGVLLRQQVVAFEMDALGAIVEVTATNSLELVLGAF